MFVEPEKQNLIRVRWIRHTPQAAKGSRAIVQRVGRDRDIGVFKRHKLVLEIRDREEVIHRS